MIKALLVGITIGFTAKEQIRKGLKQIVRGAYRNYVSAKEDVEDAIAEEKAAEAAAKKQT